MEVVVHLFQLLLITPVIVLVLAIKELTAQPLVVSISILHSLSISWFYSADFIAQGTVHIVNFDKMKFCFH